jgi:hypothetical protein
MIYLFIILITNALALPPIFKRCTSRRLPADLTYTEYLHCAACLVTAPRDHLEQHDRLQFVVSMLALNLVLIALRLLYTAVV